MTTFTTVVRSEAREAFAPFRQPRRLVAQALEIAALGAALVAFATFDEAEPSAFLVAGLLLATGVSSFRGTRAARRQEGRPYPVEMAVVEAVIRGMLLVLFFWAVRLLQGPVHASGIRFVDAVLAAWALAAAGAFLTRRSTARWLAIQLAITAFAVGVATILGPTPHPIVPGGALIAALLACSALLIRSDSGAWPSWPTLTQDTDR